MRPAVTASACFFASAGFAPEWPVEGPLRGPEHVAMPHEVRFEDAVVAFRERRFHDHNDDVRGRPRLIGPDGGAVSAVRELFIVAKQL